MVLQGKKRFLIEMIRSMLSETKYKNPGETTRNKHPKTDGG